MKTKEELNIIKEEYKTLNQKLNELTEDELNQVIGGNGLQGMNLALGFLARPNLAEANLAGGEDIILRQKQMAEAIVVPELELEKEKLM